MNRTTDDILNLIFDDVLSLSPEQKRVAYQRAMDRVYELVHEHGLQQRRAGTSDIINELYNQPNPQCKAIADKYLGMTREEYDAQFNAIWNPPAQEGFYFRERYERTAAGFVAWLRSYTMADWYRKASLFFVPEKAIPLLLHTPGTPEQWIALKCLLLNDAARIETHIGMICEYKNFEIRAFLIDATAALNELTAVIPFEVPDEMITNY